MIKDKLILSIQQKSIRSNIDINDLINVFNEAIEDYLDVNTDITPNQYAFNRVNSTIALINEARTPGAKNNIPSVKSMTNAQLAAYARVDRKSTDESVRDAALKEIEHRRKTGSNRPKLPKKQAAALAVDTEKLKQMEPHDIVHVARSLDNGALKSSILKLARERAAHKLVSKNLENSGKKIVPAEQPDPVAPASTTVHHHYHQPTAAVTQKKNKTKGIFSRINNFVKNYQRRKTINKYIKAKRKIVDDTNSARLAAFQEKRKIDIQKLMNKNQVAKMEADLQKTLKMSAIERAKQQDIILNKAELLKNVKKEDDIESDYEAHFKKHRENLVRAHRGAPRPDAPKKEPEKKKDAGWEYRRPKDNSVKEETDTLVDKIRRRNYHSATEPEKNTEFGKKRKFKPDTLTLKVKSRLRKR